MAQIARGLGCREKLGDEALADWASRAIEEFIEKIGMKRNVCEYGVPVSDFDSIATEVRANFALRIESDPVPTDAAGLTGILRASVQASGVSCCSRVR